MGSISTASLPAETFEGIGSHEARRAQGTANIMAIGTAHPPNCILQEDYADFLFRTTNSEHKVELKNKLKRICERTMIGKRYFYHDEELLKQNPNICEFKAPSLNDRHEICIREVPKLGEQAATKALEEWGRPKSSITHLIFCTSSGVDMPSADLRLAVLLGLRPDVSRYCVYMQGCYAGGTALRYAKDIAENNADARVLVVCAELTVIGYRGPHESCLDNSVGTALFGDGAGALVVGSDPILSLEKSIFEIACARQRFIPNSEEALYLQLREEGLLWRLSKDTPRLVADNIEQCVADVFESMGMEMPMDWNSLFWVPHPGGRAILDEMEARLKLRPEKFGASRRVLWEYGNLVSACVIFILDEMRKKSADEGMATTGEGLEWGVLNGFGPGMTVETVLLRSRPI